MKSRAANRNDFALDEKPDDVQTSRSENPNRSQDPISSSASRIRARLLNKLGFEKDLKELPCASSPTRTSVLQCIDRNSVFQVRLNADYGFPESNCNYSSSSLASSQSSDFTSSSDGSRRRSVSFEHIVEVLPIPARSSYSSRIRNVLWMPPAEMQENAARNCLEFAAEGWDWRSVIDESDFVQVNGEKIHPVHFARKGCNVSRDFVRVLSAQKQQRC